MENLLDNAIVQLLIVFAAIWVFLKFCSFSKNFALPGGVKKWIYIITGISVVALNWAFSSATEGMGAETAIANEPNMLMALAAAFVMLLIFSFALMSEDKE